MKVFLSELLYSPRAWFIAAGTLLVLGSLSVMAAYYQRSTIRGDIERSEVREIEAIKTRQTQLVGELKARQDQIMAAIERLRREMDDSFANQANLRDGQQKVKKTVEQLKEQIGADR